MTRNGTDRVSDPFNVFHRLYNRAKLIFELARCFTVVVGEIKVKH